MSNAIAFTADLHLGHRVAARERGFGDDVQAHDNWVFDGIYRWARENRDGTLFVLGDVAFDGWRDRLYGLATVSATLHLIAGNHDRCHPLNRNGRN